MDFALRSEFSVTVRHALGTGSIASSVRGMCVWSLRGVNLNHWTITGPQLAPKSLSLYSHLKAEEDSVIETFPCYLEYWTVGKV
jgi:hypothetical protein